MSVPKVNNNQQRYNGETELQIIQDAERLYNAGQYNEAIERIAPIYFAALRAGRVSKLPKRILKLFFPMPLAYLKYAEKSLPENIRKQPPEKIAEFLLLEFSMMRQESMLNPYAHNSRSGARGLGQIRPSTAGWIAWLKLRLRSFNLYRPADNIKIMTAYLNYLLRLRHGNKDLAAASYNAGPNKVGRYILQHHGNLKPDHIIKHNVETGEYIRIVSRNFNKYSSLYGTRILLMASGISTCKTALKYDAAIKRPAQKSDPVHVYQVCIGSFGSIGNAMRLKDGLMTNNVRIIKIAKDKGIFYRVVVCFTDKKKAEEYLAKVRSKYPDAWLPS